jgi:hypothetical protein
VIGVKRASCPTEGVWPPRANQAMPSTTVSPETRMLMATPLTTWSPRWVMQAKPCSSARQTETAMPVPSASQAEPLTAAMLAAAKAAASILPSSEMSMTPERSENRPAMAQNTSGVATRRVASKESSRLSSRSDKV